MSNLNRTDICNLALIKIGAQTITSFTTSEDTKEWRCCQRFYPAVLDAMLVRMKPTFARAREQLVQTTAPPFGLAYTYQLPLNPKCLHILMFCDETGKKIEAKWEKEGDKILTDQEECRIKYIIEVTDTTQFKPTFVLVLVDKLAAEFAVAIRQSKTLALEVLEVMLKDTLPAAQMANADESYVEGEDGEDYWHVE